MDTTILTHPPTILSRFPTAPCLQEEVRVGEAISVPQLRKKYNEGRRLSKAIIAYCGDGEFHRVKDIAAALGADVVRVGKICHRILREGRHRTFGERRPVPVGEGKWAYRYVNVKGGKKKIDVTAFLAEVAPILDDAEALLKTGNIDYSKEAMRLAFARIRKTIDRMAR